MENKFQTVISGISGKFPDCDNVPEFKTKLYNGDSFMSLVPDRWPVNYRYKYTNTVLPAATGKIKSLKKFDPAVFKINQTLAECTDALTRLILEPSFEAVMDAGINPYDLNGRNIGVFMTYDHSDSESKTIAGSIEGRLYVLGTCKSMMANRVSFALNLTGPSFTFTSDMFGTFSALNEAYESVARGHLEAAIVGIAAVAQHPGLGVNLVKMNVLSPDSITRVFDKNANGYGRSDSIVALFIQRADDAKRIYASIDFSGYTYFGSNPHSLYNFDEDLLKNSMDDLYKRENYYDIEDVSFVEMSACGIKKYDKTESNFISDTFCKNKKSPLLVGSVKSNVGMADAVSPYLGLLKAIFALESDIIVQNQNLNEINDQIKAFTENKLKVITEPTPLPGDKVVVNAVGIAGALSQIILKQYKRKELKNSSDSDNLPRLILACARTAEGIENLLTKLEETNYNLEFISIVNDVFSKDMLFHAHRGYLITSPDVTHQKKSSSDVKGNKNRPIWFLFSGMGSQWNGMGEGLLKFPIIAETVKKCDQVLSNVGVDIYHILTTTDPTVFDNIMHSFVGIITIQVALIEILKALGIKPNGIIGHSVGEIACAYADGCLTLEQAVLSSYARGMASIETKTIQGMMAAVGKGYNEIKDVLPESIEVACHNSATSCTLSGPTEDVEKYVKQLQEQKVFAKAVNVANIAYHSKHIAPAAPNLLARLKKVIPNPVKRSPIWISTSVPESDWNKPLAQYCSAEYLTNNLLSCVMFEEGSKHIPSDALVIEIAPHGLLQAIMKRSLPETCANVALTRRNNDGKNLENLLTAIGQLYIDGLDVNVNALYPAIEYPVSRNTPSISQLARWHQIAPDTSVFRYDLAGSHSGDSITISIKHDSPYYYLRDHKINHRVNLPTSFFLYFVWWVFSVNKEKKLDSHSVIFEDIKMHKNVSMSLVNTQKVAVFIRKGSGRFEILKYSKSNLKKKYTKIISGVIYEPSEQSKHTPQVDESNLQSVEYTISSDQFYNIFKDVGYHLEGNFHSLEELKYNKNDCYAKIKWCNNWVSFLDSLLKFDMFFQMKNKDDLLYTYRIRKLEIFTEHFSSLENGSTLLCHKEMNTNIITCNGLRMCSVVNRHFSLKGRDKNVKFEGLRFISHSNPRCQSVAEFFSLCLQIAVDSVGIMTKKNRLDAKLNLIIESDICSNDLTTVIKSCHKLKTKVRFHEMKPALFNKYIEEDECWMIVTNDFYNIEKFVVDFSFLLVVTPHNDAMKQTEIENKFTQITKQQFTDKTFHLFKKKSFIEHKTIHVNNGDCSRYYASKQTEPELTFIVKQNFNSTDLSVMLNDSRKPSDSRYLFVMDNEISRDGGLEEQYVQDLPVVVLQNKEWGSYQNVAKSISQSEENNTPLNNFSADIQMESIQLQYWSGDEQMEFKNDQVCNYGIEYSGIKQSGERIMGLSLIDPHQLISKPDILTWEVPKDWSLEDAATVPFYYTLAYHILDSPVVQHQEDIDTVLINFGYGSLLCEACISISLSRNQTVYVSVADNSKAAYIKSRFPQLDDKQILNAEKCSFEVELMRMTKGEGVDLVVNSLVSSTDIEKSLNCSRAFGFFLQIGEINKWETQHIGMYPFLASVSFVMVPNRMSSLLKLPNSDKKVLKCAIQDGIKTGVVVPFDKRVQIQGIPENNSKVSEKIHVKNIFKWTSKDDLCCNSNEKLRYDNHRTYIIVGGDQKDNFWFELIEWLISKGARKFIATLDSFPVGSKISHRMNRLLKQNKASIIFTSSQKTDSLQEAENLIQDANRIGPLEAVFFVSAISAEKKVYNMDMATRKLDSNVHFVSIFSGGLKECESRRCSGFPATVIHNNILPRKLSTILPQINDILSQFDNNNSPTLYHIINAENEISESPLRNYLSHDVNTLEEVADDLSNELEFVEVATKSPRFSSSKNCSPTFIISVLGPRPLQGLLSNLMNPAFCVAIGTCYDSVIEMASKLYKSLNKIENKLGVTLVSETWSSPIAFEMMKLLEQDNRKYRIFVLDGNPLAWKQRATALGPLDSSQFENNLIGELFNIDPEVRLESCFDLSKPLSEKLADYLQRHNYSSVNVFNLIKVIRSIHKGLEMVYNYEYHNLLLKNTVLLEQNFNENQSLNLSVTSEMNVLGTNDYFQFLNSAQVYNTINKNVVYTLWNE